MGRYGLYVACCSAERCMLTACAWLIGEHFGQCSIITKWNRLISSIQNWSSFRTSALYYGVSTTDRVNKVLYLYCGCCFAPSTFYTSPAIRRPVHPHVLSKGFLQYLFCHFFPVFFQVLYFYLVSLPIYPKRHFHFSFHQIWPARLICQAVQCPVVPTTGLSSAISNMKEFLLCVLQALCEPAAKARKHWPRKGNLTPGLWNKPVDVHLLDSVLLVGRLERI